MTFSASLVAVGDSYHNKGEKFENGNWSDIQEPPVNERFMGYAVIFHGGDHFFFGGFDGSNYLDSIFRLSGSSWTWSNVGQLNSVRRGHGVILANNKFTVVGGDGNQKNEACLLDNEQFTCTELSSSLNGYRWWPILHLVDENYGTC